MSEEGSGGIKLFASPVAQYVMKNANLEAVDGEFVAALPGNQKTDILQTDGTKTDENKSAQNSQKETENVVQDEDEDVKHTTTTSFVMPKIVGKTYAANQLTYQFLVKNYYNISSGTVVYESELNGQLLTKKMYLSEIKNEPQILIYHTHSQEFFKDSDESNPETGIVGAGTYLTELLEGYGYSVLHVTDTFDYVDGKLDRDNAYTLAGERLEEILEEYPSIEVIIDLHRDGVNEDLHLVTEIDGKQTAQIMFFNGMSRTNEGNISYLPNKNLQGNLAFGLQLKLKAEAYYPGFTRKNYIKPYRYNLQLREKSILIEAGAQTNTFQEVKNAMEPLAILLHIQFAGLENK
ncbi:MAG: stage II sporulation protein P [Lachnospiraceae bacterium]|nr:stage II sporulation protein P [Lachnospiraceae bacterium]